MSFGLMFILSFLSTVMFFIWFILFLKYRKKYDGLIEKIDSKIFTLKEIYFIGLGCIDIYERRSGEKLTSSDKAVAKIKFLSEVFGRDSAELYYYILNGAGISLFLTFAPIGLALGCMINSFLGFICGILLVVAMVYGINSNINSEINKKKDSIIDEFPKMVSKLTLLINAGMIVRKAWDEVAVSDYENELYSEMRSTSKDIQEGMSIDDAMNSFASRCGLKEIRKFSSIYVQCIKRGAAEAVDSMKIMSDEAWKQKKEIAKQKGEIAAGKLLIPTMIMFLGILIVVVVPMVVSMFGAF
ncbi:MAG TPA: hypothetical protein DD392_00760 [Ruminococcus sp.]|nr:hypothetical protein [Ruminococcus sp.]